MQDILEVLDGYYYLSECIVIVTTNHIEKLDPAFIRYGRIDHKCELENLSHQQLSQVMKYYFDTAINKKMLNKIFFKLDISVSELINSIIIPNLNNYNNVIKLLLQHQSQL